MSPRRRLLALLAVLLLLTVTTTAAAKQTVIDDFESASSPAPWVFSNGPEFPGASGSLASGPGATGKGAALAYDFTGGGTYVAMTLTFATPITAGAIGYSARAAGVHTVLRVIDSTNQTFQYEANRPLEAGGPTAWYPQVIDLSSGFSHFGGANDGVLHQPIAAISLLAGNALQGGLAGVAGFDDVVAWDSLSAAIDPDQTPLPPPAGASDLASRLGVNIHFTSDDKALDIIAAAGFSRVRMDLGWAGVETTKGVYDFSAFDGLVTSLASRGLKLLLILDYFNPLYPPPSDPAYLATTVPAFAAVSKAVAAHFAGKGVLYEVWNEENGGFWPPVANAAQYAALSAAAIAAVHAGDPAGVVTMGGLAGFDFPFFEAALDAGGAAGANAVGVHPYRQGGGESASDDLSFMRALVASTFTTPAPVWDTEWGYSSQWFGGDAGGHDPSARAIQAQRTSRELLSAWALGFPVAIYYDIRDDGTDPTNGEHNFGLVQNDYTDKPAIVAVRTLSQAARGRAFAGFLPTGFTTMHAMLLVGPVDRVVALWSDAPGSVTPVVVPSTAKGVDMLGAPLVLGSDAGATTVTVSEVAGPVFLTFPNPAVAVDGGGDGGTGSADGSMSGDGSSGDAAAPDGGTGSASGSSGCGCAAVGTEAGGISLFGVGGAAWLAFGARRRGRRSGKP